MPKCMDKDWATKTPWACSYTLVMYDTGGSSAQSIELTRDEFLDIKAVIAERRGIMSRVESRQLLEESDYAELSATCSEA